MARQLYEMEAGRASSAQPSAPGLQPKLFGLPQAGKASARTDDSAGGQLKARGQRSIADSFASVVVHRREQTASTLSLGDAARNLSTTLSSHAADDHNSAIGSNVQQSAVSSTAASGGTSTTMQVAEAATASCQPVSEMIIPKLKPCPDALTILTLCILTVLSTRRTILRRLQSQSCRQLKMTATTTARNAS